MSRAPLSHTNGQRDTYAAAGTAMRWTLAAAAQMSAPKYPDRMSLGEWCVLSAVLCITGAWSKVWDDRARVTTIAKLAGYSERQTTRILHRLAERGLVFFRPERGRWKPFLAIASDAGWTRLGRSVSCPTRHDLPWACPLGMSTPTGHSEPPASPVEDDTTAVDDGSSSFEEGFEDSFEDALIASLKDPNRHHISTVELGRWGHGE
jgi:hypothetical protein